MVCRPTVNRDTKNMLQKTLPIGYSSVPRQFLCRWGVALCVFMGILFFAAFIFADGSNVIEYSKWFIHEEKIDTAPFVMPSLSVDRQWFERRLSRLEQRSNDQSGAQPYLSRIVLKAQLEGRQLTSGQGSFTLHPRSDRADSIPLNPLPLAVNSLRWSDDTDAVFFCRPDGENRLLVPSETDSNSYDHLQFQWSLQSRKDQRNGIVFDLALPPCMSIELQLALPDSMVLAASAGLVLPDESNAETEPGFRTWRVLLGHHANTTLTITADKTLPSIKKKPAIRQTVVYEIKPQGLTAETRIVFDSNDSKPAELLLELEMPLRPVEVLYGDRPAAWTRSALSSDVTQICIDLSPFADEEQQERLIIRSLGPLLENQRWTLPRTRVTSPDVFWMETRCSVSVYPPLRTRNLISRQAVQVKPRSEPDWTVRELHVFQFFQDDAQIELEVVYSIPYVAVNSAIQINWSDTEIQSTVYLDCNVTEGEHFTLNFPVSEHWIIDSVTSYPPTGTFPAESEPPLPWSVAQFPTSQILSVQLNQPLRPRVPAALQISCRFIGTAQSSFRLADLSPLVLSHRHGESHYIAVQLDLTNNQLKSSADASAFNVQRTFLIGGTSRPLTGSVYPLDSRTQDIRLELERVRPNYTADISGNIYINGNELVPTFRIYCTPDSPINRIFVHFTPSGGENTPRQWKWSLSNSLRPPRIIKTSPDELRELLPISEQQNWGESLGYGEIWEVRFDELQSAPFELSAISVVPLTDSTVIPLASVPLASAQKGELTIESPQHFDYRIAGALPDAIPIAPAAWNRYQHIRAAFRYDPPEELRRSQHSPLLLQKLTPNEQVDTAWVWSLRLNTRHDPEGTVRNRVLFLVENQGRDSLQITLPYGINITDVFAVWRDSQQIPWQYDEDQRTIDVALPVGQRFVSIALEYTYQDIPLVQQRKLRPRYPTADIPILSGSWISWFPPEFDVSLRHAANDATQSAKPAPLSKALDYLLSRTYRSFLGSMWDDVFYGEQRRLEAETAAENFFAEIAETFQKNPGVTWGDLIGNERILYTIRSQLTNDNTKRIIEPKLLIDKQALAFLGITPSTPVEVTGSVNKENVRKKLFENAGLILLITSRTRSDGIKEYVFALTTPVTLSLNRQVQPVPAGHCVRAVPFEFFGSVSQSPQWIPAARWLSETTLSSIPWSISSQVLQGSVLSLDWNAYELPINSEQPLYIVHRQKFAALQWIAFLALVLLTSRKPFSSPFILFALLIVFELAARLIAPCYVGIPSGAFLGVLVSFAFVFIRSQSNPYEPSPERQDKHESTECSVSFVQTPLAVRSVLLCGLLTVLAGLSASASAQTLTEQILNSPRKEPHRIFYPTNSDGKIVGQKIWVPVEFLDLLSPSINTGDPAVLPQWNIIKAVYQGSLIRNSSGYLECSDDFKAVYDIYLDSSSVTITLPNMPAVPGRFYWNARPIQPIWSDDTQSDTLSFAIENETPGKHTLEIALSPKAVLQNDDETFHVAFAVPKVPYSILRLNVPPDIPPVGVPDALGAVTPNTATSPVLTAELGPTQQLSLTWIDHPNRNEASVNNVEQFFRMRIKPSQVELETLFRFRIDGGHIRRLTIQTDPRWMRSGQFRCDEHPIVQQSETSPNAQSFDGLSAFPINFQSPVSGTVTLRADFVLRGEFYGAGNLRQPEFSALHSRITRSMLAIYADPLLELNLPVEGRSSGFEAGWQGTSDIMPQMPQMFRDVPFLDFAGSWLSPNKNDISPNAEYDLNQTEPTWTLNIRTQKRNPDVAVVQSVQFDAGESRIRIVGEFTAVSDIFQQYFSADRPIQIETLEVRDSQNTLIESRFQQTAPETMPEQYLVLFKQPVTGKYTITVRGFFETKTQEAFLLQSVPVLQFGEAQTTEHSLHLFRTAAVIAEIPPEQNGWSKLNVLPSAPESFSSSIPLGTWRKAEATEAVLAETEPIAKTLQFALSPNRPKVKCKTVLTLQTDPDEQWTMTLDFTGNITDGELKTVFFRWDERCGVIQSVDPPASWTLEPSGGRQTLAVSFHESIRGEQHIKITVALNMSGTVSLPNVFPLATGAEQFESEIFVDLPRQQDNEIIPWDLNQLVEMEEPAAETQRLLLRAIDTHFAASINRDEARLTAVFYDIGFLIRQNGTIIGVVTVDLKNRGQDNFVLQMPQGYEPIQISSAGSILGRARLAESNRWQINIGTSDYPQRLSILFRASLSRPLKQWNREQVVSTLQFPRLEGVTVQETIWSIAFEGNLPPLDVTSIQERHGGSGTAALPDVPGSEESHLGEHQPLSAIDAALSLIGVNLIREHNLIQVLKSLPVSHRQEEKQRWFLHWLEEWNMVADKVDFQISHVPLTLHNVRPRLLIRPADSNSERTKTTGIVLPFLELMGARTQESLKVNKKQTVQEKFGSAMDAIPKQPIPILNSQVYWQGRSSEEVQYLFGSESGGLRAIRLTSVPHTSNWILPFSEYIWLWISLALLIPIFVLLSVRWIHLTELWLQFPHFWGTALGVLLWVFMPESFLGPIIIALTFIAFFRPSWTRHRLRTHL